MIYFFDLIRRKEIENPNVKSYTHIIQKDKLKEFLYF